MTLSIGGVSSAVQAAAVRFGPDWGAFKPPPRKQAGARWCCVCVCVFLFFVNSITLVGILFVVKCHIVICFFGNWLGSVFFE